MTFNLTTCALLTSISFVIGFTLSWHIKPTQSILASPQHISSIDKNHGSKLQIKQNNHQSTITSVDIISPPQAVELSEKKSTNIPNKRDQLKRLLDERKHREAVQFYSDNDDNSFKDIILSELTSSQDDNQIFTSLSEEYLAYYYADTDVLLLVANYQHANNLFDEAVLSYEFAYQYASTEKNKERVRSAFLTFVNAVDRQLSRNKEAQRLLDFYRQLREFDVATNEQTFREAELNILYENMPIVEELLERLLEDPLFKKRASAVLAEIHGENEGEIAKSLWDDEIALTQYGQHFLIDTVFNNKNSIPLLIDTGASITSISQATFSELQRRTRLIFLSTQRFNTAGGVVEGKMYRVEKINIGNYSFYNQKIVVIPIPESQTYGGLLGMNILKHFHFQIDQEKSVLKVIARNE